MRTAVLISGGVDSAVVVHKLKEEGHDLTLFYIRIGMDNGEGDCSAEEDIEMCTAIAHRYGLPLEVVSLHQEYWDNVMEYALRTVRSGLTPNPDMMCNKMIKFGYFEQRWGKDFDITATGHYATTTVVDGRKYLATAVDPVKDQTDFLAQISYEQLMHLTFPIGSMPKEEVRRIAQQAKLPNAYRKDSQGICFLGKINYNDFIRRHLGEKKGNIIELETGKKIGEHRGFWFHTIGQRKGLGLAMGAPVYVCAKDMQANTVTVGPEDALFDRIVYADEVNWISVPGLTEPLRVTARTRYHQVEQPATVFPAEGGFRLEFDQPQRAPTPGQAVVLYQGDVVLGGGTIVAVE